MTAQTEEIVQRTAAYVHTQFSRESSGHDWWHIYRVWQTALYIGNQEGADLTIVQIGALLHDIADWKFHDGDETAGPRAARQWLDSLHVESSVIEAVADIVAGISYKGAGVPDTLRSKEGLVVQDSDRLDAIGAIGIGRSFAYGGAKGRLMHDPDAVPVLHQSFEAYKASRGTTIQHFHEKLLLLRDRMNTATGKRLAERRHRFIEQFLTQFEAEWNLAEIVAHSGNEVIDIDL